MKFLILIIIPSILFAQSFEDFFKLFPPKFPKPIPGYQYEYGAVGTKGGLPEISCWEYGIEGCIFYAFIVALSILYPVALFAAVIMFVLAGIWYITGWRKPEEVHKVFMWGIIGLILAILSFALVKGLEQFVMAPLFPYFIIK
jgi:hypothetical protein